ncbi:MAG TPA: HlyD family efflux transporter periplasmic adaptor subunit [Blastocatellia bacterium]|nr:HlyD family efflux transporter periplasmic adaptor subunit [Blastocatellia bacterium]
MDKPREKSVARNRKIRRVLYVVLALGAVGAITVWLGRMNPAAQTVERSTVIVDTVKRGEMLRQVQGLGTLVPEEIVWIPAVTSGKVEKRLVQPGTTVTPDTVIFELSNQELQQQLQDAELQFKSAEAEYANKKVELETQLLNQRASAATVESDYQVAKMESDSYAQLVKEGLYSDLQYKQKQTKANELATRNELEKKRIAMTSEAMKTQLAVSQSTLDQRRALVELRRKQVADLRVRAGMHGVLQQWAVEVGQQVTPGTNLARVSDPSRLKAQVRIAETQLKDIRIGLPATIDTRNGIIPGHVTRVDPAAQNGTVTVDISLEAALPPGARPDMSVDGKIELERLNNVMNMQRPTFGQENSTIKLFKLEADEQHAELVAVEIGRTSVTTVEIVKGLKVGDKVIVSDTSQLGDNVTRIRLN